MLLTDCIRYMDNRVKNNFLLLLLFIKEPLFLLNVNDEKKYNFKSSAIFHLLWMGYGGSNCIGWR